MSDLARRRDRYVQEVADRYGVTLHPHPRQDDVVVVDTVQFESLHQQVILDPKLDAIGRGYYWFLGLELCPRTVPVWMTDPLALALLRLRVVTIDRPMRPVIRWLSRLLPG